ncbi:MAG TPA: arylamine N-acetyltransferase [Candidatus Aphodovivens avistercoris]|nr:arylamine N-acetyltransferase [Candidatus Aphodovivens avistercoris]
MFEELHEELPDTGLYWQKLGMEAPKEQPNRELLDQMIYAHQCRIPFEDLDIYENKLNVSLGMNDMFDKIIRGKRGGFCFELNALFHELLAETGFQVSAVLGRSLKDAGYVFPITHRAMIVTLGGERLFCDVGYGGPMPPCAIPLEDGCEVSSHGQAFRIERGEQAPWWNVYYLGNAAELEAARAAGEPEREPISVVGFMDAPMNLNDFVPLSHYCCTSPLSSFTFKRMANRRTDNGSVSITNDEFTRVTPEGKETVQIESRDQLDQILKDEFGIVM